MIYDSNMVSVAVVGVLATCVGGLLWIIKFMFGKLVPTMEQQTKVTNKLIAATANNTRATKSADEYLRERNGRDKESHAETLKAIQAIPTTMQQIADNQATAIITAVKVKEQHIEHQHVEHETIEAKA